jgi:hypothetical protein
MSVCISVTPAFSGAARRFANDYRPGWACVVPTTVWSKSTMLPVIRPDSPDARNAIARGGRQPTPR